jgi:hypothetical protein
MRQTRTSTTSRRDALRPLVVSERNPRYFSVAGDAGGPPFLEEPAGGVRELPNEISLAGIDGECVSPAHRDHYVGGLGDLVDERLRRLLKQVDAHLGHRFAHTGVNFLG